MYDYIETEDGDYERILCKSYVFGSVYRGLSFGKDATGVIRTCLQVGPRHKLSTDFISIKPYTEKRMSEGTQEETCAQQRQGFIHWSHGDNRAKTRHLTYEECQLYNIEGHLLWTRSNERE